MKTTSEQKTTTIPQYKFTLVTTNKPKDWSLHQAIKRHFRIYKAKNLHAALRELAENLMSEFGEVDSYEIIKLGDSARQINIGNVLVAKFSWSWLGWAMKDAVIERVRAEIDPVRCEREQTQTKGVSGHNS